MAENLENLRKNGLKNASPWLVHNKTKDGAYDGDGSRSGGDASAKFG